MKKARVNLASTEIDKLNQICEAIVDIAKKTKVKFNGPIPLPTKKLKLTTRKSPDGEGKASWERYEMRIHKRLIDLGVDERALRLVMRVQIPEGVNIEIDLIARYLERFTSDGKSNITSKEFLKVHGYG